MGRGAQDFAVFPENTKVLLVCINKTAKGTVSTYDVARYSWKINPTKAKQAKYVMAVSKGIIVGVYEADDWLPATKAHFADIPSEHANWDRQKNRFGFVGGPASKDASFYIDKCVAAKWRFRGNPIRYVNF
jgi:hypothetical protein